MSLREAITLGLDKLAFQLKIRPRIRLFSKLILILFIAFVATSQAKAYLRPKKAQIKINGQAILVAQNAPDRDNSPVEIKQSVVGRRSPFDYKKPVDGYISQGYSAYHRANDIAAPFGAPIHSIGSGVVEFAGFANDGYGNEIIIDHGDGLKSVYAHMNQIKVGVGNMVGDSTTVGTIGLTGRTTGPHVHLEVLDNGVQIDPGEIIGKN